MNDKNPKNQTKEMAVNVNLDTTPILYTDNIFMTANENGLVLDICQKLGPTNQLRIVARVGMSRTHAKKFINELGKLILLSEGQVQTGKETKN